MSILISLVAFLVLVSIVITIHEYGHFLMARLSNIKVLEFSIGFGPKLLSKKIGKDQTLFTFRLLPLGGFVKPLEKNAITEDEWKNLSETDKERTFSNASKGKKFIMVAGGPFFNFLLAFVLYIFALSFIGTTAIPPKIAEIVPDSIFAKSGIVSGEVIKKINGKPVDTMNEAFSLLANNAIKGSDTTLQTDLKENVVIKFSELDLSDMKEDLSKVMGIYFAALQGDIVVKNIDSQSPAAKSGLKVDDMIKSINAKEAKDLNQFIRIVNQNSDKSLIIEVMRNNELISLTVTPEPKKQGNSIVGKIGAGFKIINFVEESPKKLNFIDGVSLSAQKVVDSTYTTFISLGKLVTGQLSMKTISGPLAIADYSGRSAQIGLYAFLSVMAAISIAVGVFNLLPIPVLDGGSLVQYTIEAIRRKDFSQAFLQKAQFVGVSILGSMFFIALFNDITKYIVL